MPSLALFAISHHRFLMIAFTASDPAVAPAPNVTAFPTFFAKSLP